MSRSWSAKNTGECFTFDEEVSIPSCGRVLTYLWCSACCLYLPRWPRCSLTKAFLQSTASNNKTSYMQILQTFHQFPATCQRFSDDFFFEMFRAQKSWFCYEESVLSMLALDEIAPSVSPLDVLWKREEMKACWIAFRVIIAISTAKSGTVSSSSFRRRRKSILGRESVVHCWNILMKTTERRHVSL